MAKPINVIYVFVLVSIGQVCALCGNTKTDTDAMATRIQKCADPIEFSSPDFVNQIEPQLNRICSNLECRLKCIATTLQNCDTTNDFYVMFDMVSGIAAYRGLCANQAASVAALTNCMSAIETASTPCIPSYQAKVALMDQYQENGDGTQYKEAACSGAADMANCIDVVPSGSCTQTHADLMNVFMQTTYSFPGTCGHSNDTAFYRDYSGPVEAPITCGAEHMRNTAYFLSLSFVLALQTYL